MAIITSPYSSCVILDLQSPWKWAPAKGSKDPPPPPGTPLLLPFMRANWLVMLILKCASNKAWLRQSHVEADPVATCVATGSHSAC